MKEYLQEGGFELPEQIPENDKIIRECWKIFLAQNHPGR